MSILVQKPLTSELRLKRYGYLKLQGLKYKIAGADFEFILKTWTRL
jgi:hypothetical protein